MSDLTITNIISIDSASTKDIDDAIWIEKHEATGGYQVTVYIANVSSEVPLGSKIDTQAMELGFSIYRGHRGCVRPMIPRHLSENKLSLIQDQERETVAIHISLDSDLKVIGNSFTPGVNVKNANQLSHEQADIIIAEENNESPIKATLMLMMDFAKKMLSRRRINGAMAFYDVKKGVYINEDGHLVRIQKERLYNSQIIVQEFMILANSVSAEYFATNKIPALYRNHKVGSAAPDSKALASEIETALAIDDPLIVENISRRLSLVLSKATIDRTLHGHYALNLPAYTYITSPIRRLPDLINQRILVAHLTGAPGPYSPETLDVIAAQYNELCIKEEQDRSEAFRGLSERASRIALENDALSKLDDTEFYRVSRLIAKSEDLTSIPEQFEIEWIRRAGAGTLTLPQIANAIGCLKDLFSSDGFKATMVFLNSCKHNAPSIWNILTTKYGFNEPVITDITESSPDAAPIVNFQVVGSFIAPDGTEYKTSVTNGKRKRYAEQNCYFRLLLKYLGISSNSITKIVAAENGNTSIGETSLPFNADEADGKNYKGCLFELCQKVKLPQPTIALTAKGSPPTQLFCAEVKVVIPGNKDVLIAQGKECSTKKGAEHEGAKTWLENYQSLPLFSQALEKPAALPVTENAISYLNEMEQKKIITNLTYDISEKGASFECVVSFKLKNKPHHQKGFGHNKKDAKSNAADAAYNLLKTSAF